MKQTQLTIDLSKEKFNFSAIQNLHEIITIRFENYTDKIEIPFAINEYPNITKLKFIGKSGHDSFAVPDNLDKFIHIRVLIIWNFGSFSEIKQMPQLEEFHAIVTNVQQDTKEIITLFPNLKVLVIGGAHLKNQKLPHETGNLSSLEELYLISLGLNNLPNSFGNLKQLRELVLRGNTLNGFPEVITQLENLEKLEIDQRFSSLPDSFINLKKLKKLQLSNPHGFPSTLDGRKIKPTPIPAVIGKLENIEDLDIELVDLYDITPILPLKNLKKLSLKNSALQNCKGFSNFPLLEELNLERGFSLMSVEGLEGLPIKKLNLASARINSIDKISTLTLLETLDVNSCHSLKNFASLFSHPTIKELKADDEIMKKWEERERFSKLVTIDDVISQLKTEDLKKFEESISHLSDHVHANYTAYHNPLAGYFNVKIIDDEMTSIEVLDTAIQKHLKNLSDKTLVTIFQMTFKTMGYDNYTAALLVLEEVILRKNTETQLEIVNQFRNACEDYSSGHRFWSGTVQDQLIDRLFAQFTSEALYEVLKIALEKSLLDNQDGDSMDALFIPALQNTEDEKLREKIITVFLDYVEKIRNYVESNYFDKLFEEIKNIVSPELKNLISKRKEENKDE